MAERFVGFKKEFGERVWESNSTKKNQEEDFCNQKEEEKKNLKNKNSEKRVHVKIDKFEIEREKQFV